jgi:hypothetical protein
MDDVLLNIFLDVEEHSATTEGMQHAIGTSTIAIKKKFRIIVVKKKL